MKAYPPTCFSCSAHENEYLRILPRTNKNAPTCKSCGFKLEGKFGYLCCAKSNSCFQLCSTCRICTKNHILRNVLSLKHFQGNALYANNKFNCHGCKKEKEVGEKGVMHCEPCAFSICMSCIEGTEALWDNLNSED